MDVIHSSQAQAWLVVACSLVFVAALVAVERASYRRTRRAEESRLAAARAAAAAETAAIRARAMLALDDAEVDRRFDAMVRRVWFSVD